MKLILSLKVVALILAGFASSNAAQAQVTFDWAVVGDPGNAPDILYPSSNPDNFRFGAVNYTYRISRHEVTNSQYSEFLNRVAASDPNNLFNPSMDINRSGNSGSYAYSPNPIYENNPVRYVSYIDAMRFTNWLHNGQGNGGTESGAYTIGNGINETRAVGAQYFIPSENEWYKAAYYDPRVASQGGPSGDDNYWFYPTLHDSDPIAEPPSGGVNSANYNSAVGDTTMVGAYSSTTGFYGTFDQGGNLSEWNESVIFSTDRIHRGGSWANASIRLSAGSRRSDLPTAEIGGLGFRVAAAGIPEPNTGLLIAMGVLVLSLQRRKGSRPC
jgi:formylglycine-generating enzyme